MRTETELSPATDDLDVVGPTETETDVVLAESAERSLVARMLSELAGSFIFIFVGLGALLLGGLISEPDDLTPALVFGLALTAAFAAFGAVSGGHFNPAVSLGAAIAGRIRWADMVPYWLSQLVGGIAAAGLWFVAIPDGLANFTGGVRAQFAEAAPAYGAESTISVMSQGQVAFSIAWVLVLEAIASAILVAVVLGATTRARIGTAAIAIGLTFTALLITLGPVTGGGVNPLRATATALFAEPWTMGQLWLFWVAPLIGGAVAGLIFTVIGPRGAVEFDDDLDAEDWETEDETAGDETAGQRGGLDPDAEGATADLEEPDEHVLVVDTSRDEPELTDLGAATATEDAAHPGSAEPAQEAADDADDADEPDDDDEKPSGSRS